MEYYGLKWRIEYIRLYSFVDKIMQKYFSDDTEFWKKYLLHKRYDLFKVGAQNEKAKVARVKSRLETIEKPKEVERKRLLGFAIFILIKAKISSNEVKANSVVDQVWTWWEKNLKLKNYSRMRKRIRGAISHADISLTKRAVQKKRGDCRMIRYLSSFSLVCNQPMNTWFQK